MPEPSPRFKGQLRVSASRIKSLMQCSYKLYLNDYEKLPEKTHVKTSFGSLCHSILECIAKPKHRKHFDAIKAARSVIASAACTRLAAIWKRKAGIPDEEMLPLDSCIMVAIDYSDVLGEKATEVLKPEWEFYMEGEKFHSKGFLDRLVREDDIMVIKDYKSKTVRPGKANEKEMMDEFEIQATIYQLAVWKYFKLPARVEFYLLRCPPTKKKPDAYIRVFKPKNEVQLQGAELYYEYIGEFFRRFSLKNAYENFLGKNRAKKYFCDYVCQFKNAFEYQTIVKDEKVVRNALMDEVIELKAGESLEHRTHKGCPFFAPSKRIRA